MKRLLFLFLALIPLLVFSQEVEPEPWFSNMDTWLVVLVAIFGAGGVLEVIMKWVPTTHPTYGILTIVVKIGKAILWAFEKFILKDRRKGGGVFAIKAPSVEKEVLKEPIRKAN